MRNVNIVVVGFRRNISKFSLGFYPNCILLLSNKNYLSIRVTIFGFRTVKNSSPFCFRFFNFAHIKIRTRLKIRRLTIIT